MMKGLNIVTNRLLVGFFVFAVIVMFAGCVHTQDTSFGGLQEDIPDGANRILLQQEAVPPADAYVDALNYFERAEGWQVVVSEETRERGELEGLLQDDDPLALAARGQVGENMALRLALNVDRAHEGVGAVTIASVEHADRLPAEQWQQAEWTQGQSRRAFFEGLEVLRGTAYDAVDFEIGAAIAPGKMSRGDLTTSR